jgi:hypothetical protein
LKAKTPEGLNLENTAIAHVVVLLEKRNDLKKALKKARTKTGKKRTKASKR